MEIPIEKILENYSVNAPERIVRQQIIEILEEVVGIKVDLESVSYQKGKIYIDTSPLARSQIQMRKEEIMKKIENRIVERKIKNIN